MEAVIKSSGLGGKEADSRAAALLSGLPERLLTWYPPVRRNLPWRDQPTPYHVWLSEIMLQQTRIEAVTSYYDRFLAAFPDIPSLAGAEETQVLKLWEGLGYYNRARNLMRTAKICTERFGGELPCDYEELRRLPGIGDYTAGAIASIAFHIPVAAVDGNVLRVMARFLADDGDVTKSSVKGKVQKELTALLPGVEDPGMFNEALMELGETVCLPSGKPLCGACPLREACLAAARDIQEELPFRSAGKPRTVEELTVLVLSAGGRYAIRKRPDTGLLAGMYELPHLAGYRNRQEVADWMEEHTGKGNLTPLPAARHLFTHIEWRMTGWKIEVPEQAVPEEGASEASEPGMGGFLWITPEMLRERYPLPSAFRAYMAYIR